MLELQFGLRVIPFLYQICLLVIYPHVEVFLLSFRSRFFFVLLIEYHSSGENETNNKRSFSKNVLYTSRELCTTAGKFVFAAPMAGGELNSNIKSLFIDPVCF